MPLCQHTLNALSYSIGETETRKIAMLASRVDALEAKWRRKLEISWRRIETKATDSLEQTGRVGDVTELFEKFFVEHAFAVMFEAVRSTKRIPQVPRLAYPKGPMPKSLRGLMEMWDRWRKKGHVPMRQKKIVAKVRDAYVKKCQDTWRQHSEAYRAGDSMDRKAIVAEIQKAGRTQQARSRTIVETETTRYWNEVRRDLYDQSEDVTHYLFVPVRDFATTEWCKSRLGLVYEKGSQYLDKETPPIHWNCRSEILPLTPQNPRHKALIMDGSRRRANRKPKALPPGWNAG